MYSYEDVHEDAYLKNILQKLHLCLQPTIKQLVTVTEMLSKHKQKYMEMIR